MFITPRFRIASQLTQGASMATIEEQIAELDRLHKEKISKLKAKQEQIEARKVQALIKGKRADDTRRKILAGAMALEMAERDKEAKQRFLNGMDKFLTRDDDRALFGLPKLADKEMPKEKESTPKIDLSQIGAN